MCLSSIISIVSYDLHIKLYQGGYRIERTSRWRILFRCGFNSILHMVITGILVLIGTALYQFRKTIQDEIIKNRVAETN